LYDCFFWRHVKFKGIAAIVHQKLQNIDMARFLPSKPSPATSAPSPATSAVSFEAALRRTGGVQKQAAEILGLKPTTLNEKIKRLGIQP